MKNKNYSFKVTENCRLLDFLIDHIPESRNTVKHLMGAGFAAADGISVTKFDHPLRAGQTVTVSSENAVRSSMPFGILYEDSDIIVINKSAGLLCVGNDREKERTAYRFLSDYMRAKNEGGRVYVIHRLDRDTSGIVMFAKSDELRKAYQDNWDRLVKKRRYDAVCEGVPSPAEDTITSYLRESSSHMVYTAEKSRFSKEAVTHYKTVKAGKHFSLLDIEIMTGRKNQIRVQLAEHGNPIAGDKKYGAATNPIHRLALHASELEIMSPSGKHFRFRAPIPASFAKAVK